MSRFLVDTHALLWWLLDSEHLSSRASETIADPRNEILVSAVSAWEIAIKRGQGKLKTPDSLVASVPDLGFRWLPVTAAHTRLVEYLPNHHRDPFDRMLIAQASSEHAVLISHDRRFAAYGAPLLW